MLKVTCLSSLLLMLLCACSGNKGKLARVLNDSTSQLSQHRSINGLDFHFQYLPQANKGAGDELCLRLNIKREKPGIEGFNPNSEVANYGVDTLFELITGQDTVLPVHAMRVANGTLNGVEFLVIFDKASLPPGKPSFFVFKDWLFTSRQIEFIVNPEAVAEADELRKSI